MTTVLGIWAHPDDEVFVSGGLMIDAIRSGHRVVCLHMTRGEGGLSFRRHCPPEVLAALREGELKASLESLGVEEQHFLGYRDGGLSRISVQEGAARILSALVRFQPDVIVTFGPDGYTGHPDHKALSRWVTSAVERWDGDTLLYHASVSADWHDAFVPALNEFDFFWPGHPVVFEPTHVRWELDDESVDAKVDALRKHASQMKPLFDSYGDRFMRAMSATENFRVVTPAHQRTRAPAEVIS